MSIYHGRHAALYDLFYADKPYAAEVEFVHGLFGEIADEPVRRLLDVACGTGRHALQFHRQGYEVVGTDVAEDMLGCAHVAAAAAAAEVRFERQDMRALDIPGPAFDAAVCLFDAVGHVRTNAEIRDVFDGVRRHLRPGGLFVLEFWHAAAILAHYEPLRIRRFETSDGDILRISETSLDCQTQTARVRHSIYEHRTNGTYDSAVESQTNRFFGLQEMSSLLESCRFETVQAFSGYRRNETIDRDTWHIVLVARLGTSGDEPFRSPDLSVAPRGRS